MERTARLDLDDRKELYIQPALISHAPLRDITAFQSDCNNPLFGVTLVEHNTCHTDHDEPFNDHGEY